MIKKSIVCCFAFASLAGHACTVFYSTSSSDVAKAIEQAGWGFDNYAAVCERLRKAGASLEVQGMATVLHNRSVAWAAVGLKDKDMKVYTNDFGGLSTNTNDFASIDKANQMLMESINQAVNKMDIGKAIQSLNESRQQAKAVLSR